MTWINKYFALTFQIYLKFWDGVLKRTKLCFESSLILLVYLPVLLWNNITCGFFSNNNSGQHADTILPGKIGGAGMTWGVFGQHPLSHD